MRGRWLNGYARRAENANSPPLTCPVPYPSLVCGPILTSPDKQRVGGRDGDEVIFFFRVRAALVAIRLQQ